MCLNSRKALERKVIMQSYIEYFQEIINKDGNPSEQALASYILTKLDPMMMVTDMTTLAEVIEGVKIDGETFASIIGEYAKGLKIFSEASHAKYPLEGLANLSIQNADALNLPEFSLSPKDSGDFVSKLFDFHQYLINQIENSLIKANSLESFPNPTFKYPENFLKKSFSTQKAEKGSQRSALSDKATAPTDIRRHGIKFDGIDDKVSQYQIEPKLDTDFSPEIRLIESFTGDKISESGSETKADFINAFINQSLFATDLEEAKNTLSLTGKILVRESNGQLSEQDLSEEIFIPAMSRGKVTCFKNEEGEIEFEVVTSFTAALIKEKSFSLNAEGKLQEQTSEHATIFGKDAADRFKTKQTIPLCTYVSTVKLSGNPGHYHLEYLSKSWYSNCSNLHSVLDRDEIPKNLENWIPIKIFEKADPLNIDDLRRCMSILITFNPQEWRTLSNYPQKNKAVVLLINSHLLNVIDDTEKNELEKKFIAFLDFKENILKSEEKAYKIEETVTNLIDLLTKLQKNEPFDINQLSGIIDESFQKFHPSIQPEIFKHVIKKVHEKLPLTKDDFYKINKLADSEMKNKSLGSLRGAFRHLNDNYYLKDYEGLESVDKPSQDYIGKVKPYIDRLITYQGQDSISLNLEDWAPIKTLNKVNPTDYNDLRRSMTVLRTLSDEEWTVLNNYSQNNNFKFKLAALLVNSHLFGVIPDSEKQTLSSKFNLFLDSSILRQEEEKYGVEETVNKLIPLLTKLQENEFFDIEELTSIMNELTKNADKSRAPDIRKHVIQQVNKQLLLTHDDFDKINQLYKVDSSLGNLLEAFQYLKRTNNLQGLAVNRTTQDYKSYIHFLTTSKEKMKWAEQYNELPDEKTKKAIAYKMTEILLSEKDGNKLANAIKLTCPDLYQRVSEISQTLYQAALKDPQEKYLQELIEQLNEACTPGIFWAYGEDFEKIKNLILNHANNPDQKLLKINQYYNNDVYYEIMGDDNYHKIEGLIEQVNMIHFPLARVKQQETQQQNQQQAGQAVDFISVKGKIQASISGLEAKPYINNNIKVIDKIKQFKNTSRIVTGFLKTVGIMVLTAGLATGYYVYRALMSLSYKKPAATQTGHKVQQGLTFFDKKKKQMGAIKVDTPEPPTNRKSARNS